ncbi:hypothetical protein [Arthrobacter humicola]|uniref:hypothetical protein n=1 Tax=Arthrobacter humicola TaxID=409291 RepID=UPI0031DFA5F4
MVGNVSPFRERFAVSKIAIGLATAGLCLAGCASAPATQPAGTQQVTASATPSSAPTPSGIGPSAVSGLMPTAADLAGQTSIPTGLQINFTRTLGDWVQSQANEGPCRFTTIQVPVFATETPADPSWSLPVIDFDSSTSQSDYSQAIRVFSDESSAQSYIHTLQAKLPECAMFSTPQNTPFTISPQNIAGLPDGAIAWTATASTTDTIIVFPVKNTVVRISGMGVSQKDLVAAARLAFQKIAASTLS